ncbi:hypothetical protein MLD38_004961 [Melastoma candidum]|uniref:Uncharacterized protein n=1 Tax=Melastoma candidum TaxID=119954 RepID=A0ACB9S723_9MYRT|nr:hypothetical protein MLD38_004961 [Melastoma candidum]
MSQDNPELGLVQARWTFMNKNGNLLIWMQSIKMIAALEDSGGWLERITVEGMDVVVFAHLKGWKFIFLNDVLCKLPESYEAYINSSIAGIQDRSISSACASQT